MLDLLFIPGSGNVIMSEVGSYFGRSWGLKQCTTPAYLFSYEFEVRD